ncbi:MAG: molybdopterin molybdotransferase MoeA [Candidatus Nitrohelix vancouverensis]|uniref:Molybdopterin molybdenumtransferase n=1 Tax=Candidatus Nitrohelix vancouverensis TaxID=2705534 RepID=A0A7T0C1X4_9BACT|nr:MAG: molybdopterin molybdotransferase MoeA [Candidatus Nitrohelix vancouverensis]
MSTIKVEEALEIILSRIEFKGLEKISITEALGRTLMEDIVARRDNPPMDNSAMDGYALIAADIESATPEAPVPLTVVGEVAAGYTAQGDAIKSGQAMRIMTGAPIPAGADAVIMQEDTDRNGDQLLVKDRADLHENIRDAGEDVKAGEVVIPKGARIQPAHIGMMATVGRSQIYVGRKPTVAILSTGDEILDLDDQPEGPCIYNSNGYMLSAQIRSAGGVPHYLGIARDTEADLMEKFQTALQCDLVVSSGGVSVGDYDLVKASLKKMGQEMLFWKVAMKPGKPLAFGRIGETPVFGLPGNPVSSFVSFEQFVRPSIKKMAGNPNLKATVVQARLSQAVSKKAGRQHFLSSITTWEKDGYTVTPAGEQGSGILKSASQANSLMIFPLESTRIEAGETVSVQLLEQS